MEGPHFSPELRCGDHSRQELWQLSLLAFAIHICLWEGQALCDLPALLGDRFMFITGQSHAGQLESGPSRVVRHFIIMVQA